MSALSALWALRTHIKRERRDASPALGPEPQFRLAVVPYVPFSGRWGLISLSRRGMENVHLSIAGGFGRGWIAGSRLGGGWEGVDGRF